MADISDLQSNTTVLLHDTFNGLSYWDDCITDGEPAWSGVAMDVHIYQMFSDGEHICVACSQGSALSFLHPESQDVP